MRKNEQNRKRSRSESRGIEAKEDLNYEDEESELSSGDLSSSDLDLSYDYNAHIPKKRSKRKAREGSHSYAPPPKGYVSDIDETGEEKIDKYGELLGGKKKVHIYDLSKYIYQGVSIRCLLLPYQHEEKHCLCFLKTRRHYLDIEIVSFL